MLKGLFSSWRAFWAREDRHLNVARLSLNSDKYKEVCLSQTSCQSKRDYDYVNSVLKGLKK